MKPKVELCIMGWLAGDTGRITGDLRDAIRRDLDELREGARLAGDTMAVWAAFDDGQDAMWMPMSHLTGVQEFRSLNMADPGLLRRFCDYVMGQDPASQYVLIVGGHGSGIKRQDVYRGPKPVELGRVGQLMDHIADASKKATVDLAYDDGAGAAMSVADLGMVCRHIAGKGKLSLLVLDACYMAGVEVCEALIGGPEVLVASPEAIPGQGFPYADLLNRWAKSVGDGSESLGARLARDAVEEFRRYYEDRDEVASILAVDMKGVPLLLEQMDALAVYAEQPPADDLRWSAEGERAGDPDFIYLASFCGRTSWYCRVTPPLLDSWASAALPTPGLTVFLPERGPLPRWYSDLPLAQRPWGQMVKRIVEA